MRILVGSAILAFLTTSPCFATAEKFAALEGLFENEGKLISMDAVRKPASTTSYAGIRSGYCIDKAERTLPYAFISEVKANRVVWMLHSLQGYAKADQEKLPKDYVAHLKKNVYSEKSQFRKLFTLPAETASGLSFFKTVPLKMAKSVGDPAAQQYFVKETPSVFQGMAADILMKITCEKTDGCEEASGQVAKGSVTHYCRFAGSRLQPW